MISANALKNLIRYKYFTVKFDKSEIAGVKPLESSCGEE